MRPDKGASRARPTPPAALSRGLVAGLIVVALGGAAVWWFFGRGVAPDAAPKAPKAAAITEAKPALPVAGEQVEKAPKKEAPKKLPPQQVGETRNGYRLLPNGRLHRVVGVITSHVARVGIAMKTFDRPADQLIACLLTVKPGDALLGDSSEYYKDFDKQFRESLEEQIVIGADDSDEVKELKRAVIETKKELKEKMDKGEDLAAIMRESREQLRELGLYRDELTAQVKGIAGDLNAELSEKDLHDLVDAANKMLDERGSEPLQLTGPMLYQLREQKLDQENTTTEIHQ